MDDDKPKSTPFSRFIMAKFLRETAHLGPEGQRRVLDAIVAYGQHKRASLEAQAAIDKARREITYPVRECSIGINRGPPPPGLGTYDRPPPYVVDEKPDPSPVQRELDLGPTPRPILRLS